MFSRFIKNPNEFQQFLHLNSEEIIRTGFIFHIQPYNPLFSTFIIHIFPSCNGKANETTINILNEKRLRYRLFGVRIYCDFDKSGEFFDTDQLKKICQNILNIVWCDKYVAQYMVPDGFHGQPYGQ